MTQLVVLPIALVQIVPHVASRGAVIAGTTTNITTVLPIALLALLVPPILQPEALSSV